MSPDYVAKVFWEAVYCLATGDEPAKLRLQGAGMMLTKLRGDGIPQPLRGLLDKIMYALTADPRSDFDGSLASTISTMTDHKVKEVTEQIIHCYAIAARADTLKEHYEE